MFRANVLRRYTPTKDFARNVSVSYLTFLQGWSSVGSGATTQHQGRDSRLAQSETDKNILPSTFRAKALRLES